jgi:hypothetical protein
VDLAASVAVTDGVRMAQIDGRPPLESA